MSLFIEAGIGTHDDPGNLARFMVWADRRYGRPFFRKASLDFAAALE